MYNEKFSMHEQLQSMEETAYWWFVGRREIAENMFRKYIVTEKLSENFKILDIGCGMGGEIKWLEQYGDVFAVDPEPQAVYFSKEKAKKPNQVICGALPAEINFGKIFDCVVALDVLEHIENDRLSLEFVFNNLLKSGGFLIITVPAYKFLWSPNDVFNDHKRRYNVRELKSKLEKAGFKIIKLSYYNTLLFMPAFIIKLLSRVVWGLAPKATFSKPIPILNTVFKKMFSFEKYLIKRFNLPFGVSLISIAKKEIEI